MVPEGRTTSAASPRQAWRRLAQRADHDAQQCQQHQQVQETAQGIEPAP